MMANAHQSIRKEIARTAMAKDVFGRYKPEERHELRENAVEENETIKQLKTAFREFSGLTIEMRRIEDSRKREDQMDDETFASTVYEIAVDKIKGIKYTAEDVEKFSLSISEATYENATAGIFLSALINKGDESDYVIHTAHWEFDIAAQALCYRNTKNVTINGDGGYLLGWYATNGRILVLGDVTSAVGDSMENAEIIVKGNAKGWAGSDMKSGSITIEGNTGGHAGARMKGGKLIIKGNSGHSLGYTMEGGEIHIEGDYVDIHTNIKGGKIFHKEVLIYPKEDGDI